MSEDAESAEAVGHVSKECEFGHHYYTGISCPLCDYLGRENLKRAFNRGESST